MSGPLTIFEHNIRLIRRKSPELAGYIERLEIPRNMAPIKSRSGHPTIRIEDGAGRATFIHSPVDPVAEARILIENHPFHREDGTIILGLGMGYLVKEIIRKKDRGHVLYLAEAVPEFLKMAATYSDLSDIFADEGVFLFVGESVLGMPDRFEHIQAKAVTGIIRKIAMPSLWNSCAEVYREVDRRINEHVITIRVSSNTADSRKELFLANPFQNLPAITSSSSIKGLEDVIKGYPALIASAGPSLTNDLYLIRERRKEFFLIAVDSSLKPLMRQGIHPDLAVTCDPLTSNAMKIDGLPKEFLASIPLVYLPECNPNVADAFGRMRIIVDSANLLSSWLVRLGHETVSFPSYQTVSHLGFLIARFMGADPILLVGMDLSFPVDKSHAEDSANTWEVDFQNFSFKHVPSNNGGSVRTIPDFMTSIHIMERELRRTRSRCINVSRDGALIRGTEAMSLEEALNLVKRPVDPVPSFGELLTGACHTDPLHAKEKVAAGLKWLISEAEHISRICDRASSCSQPSQDLFASALAHKEFLRILRDYMLGYIRAAARSPYGETQAPPNEACSESEEKKVTIFFQELSTLLPDLLSHSRRALEKILELPTEAHS